DGKSLVLGQSAGIVAFTVHGGRLTGRRVLVRQSSTAATTGNRWVGIPSWSADGQWVVYVRQETTLGGSDIYKVRVSDGSKVRLTHAPYGLPQDRPELVARRQHHCLHGLQRQRQHMLPRPDGRRRIAQTCRVLPPACRGERSEVVTGRHEARPHPL